MPNELLPNPADSIGRAFTQAFAGIRMLSAGKLLEPCLVLLYSTIDAAAWLGANHDGDVTREDFVLWVDRFLLPESGLECSAIELYAARCGVLHSFSAYSSLQRQGKARLLCYAWGSAKIEEVQKVLQYQHPGKAVAVHLDLLSAALFRAWGRFLVSIESEPETVRQISRRGTQLFTSVPETYVKKALEKLRGTNG